MDLMQIYCNLKSDKMFWTGIYTHMTKSPEIFLRNTEILMLKLVFVHRLRLE
jgi:hypothetical protein